MPLIIVPLAIDILTFASLWTSQLSYVAKAILTATIILKYAIQLAGIYTERSARKNVLCISSIMVSSVAAIVTALIGKWFLFAHCLLGMLLFAGWCAVSTFNLFRGNNGKKDELHETK